MCDLLINSFKLLCSNDVIFFLFECILGMMLVYSQVYVWKMSGKYAGIKGSVRRGDHSWSSFPIGFALMSIFAVAIVSHSTWIDGYQSSVIVVDLAAIFYLCFFNGWFRNLIIKIAGNSKNMWEA